VPIKSKQISSRNAFLFSINDGPGCYGLLFFVISALLADADIGLDNKSKSGYRVIGYASYVAVE
jgi:hypothetical protein